MNLKLQTIIQKLEKKFPRKIDLTLERQLKILKKLGNPQDKLEQVISVVGTNSKFSIIYTIFSILKESGHKCNLFVSPHVQS
jgi:dihydrofolate synthase/folylpolyglutamate synthase